MAVPLAVLKVELLPSKVMVVLPGFVEPDGQILMEDDPKRLAVGFWHGVMQAILAVQPLRVVLALDLNLNVRHPEAEVDK
jgi:hypothetical protein